MRGDLAHMKSFVKAVETHPYSYVVSVEAFLLGIKCPP